MPYLRDFGIPEPGGGMEIRGAGHGGSHPWLVHEFLSSIAEGQPATIYGRRSAAWSAPGICAHESALRGGVPMDVPQF